MFVFFDSFYNALIDPFRCTFFLAKPFIVFVMHSNHDDVDLLRLICSSNKVFDVDIHLSFFSILFFFAMTLIQQLMKIFGANVHPMFEQ
jgi:hypothetical protein